MYFDCVLHRRTVSYSQHNRRFVSRRSFLFKTTRNYPICLLPISREPIQNQFPKSNKRISSIKSRISLHLFYRPYHSIPNRPNSDSVNSAISMRLAIPLSRLFNPLFEIIISTSIQSSANYSNPDSSSIM